MCCVLCVSGCVGVARLLRFVSCCMLCVRACVGGLWAVFFCRYVALALSARARCACGGVVWYVCARENIMYCVSCFACVRCVCVCARLRAGSVCVCVFAVCAWGIVTSVESHVQLPHFTLSVAAAGWPHTRARGRRAWFGTQSTWIQSRANRPVFGCMGAKQDVPKWLLAPGRVVRPGGVWGRSGHKAHAL